MKEYHKSGDGLVHAANPLNSEIAACGDAPEGWVKNVYSGEKDSRAFVYEKKVVRGPVTCPDCAHMIVGLRGYRVRPAGEAHQ